MEEAEFGVVGRLGSRVNRLETLPFGATSLRAAKEPESASGILTQTVDRSRTSL